MSNDFSKVPAELDAAVDAVFAYGRVVKFSDSRGQRRRRDNGTPKEKRTTPKR